MRDLFEICSRRLATLSCFSDDGTSLVCLQEERERERGRRRERKSVGEMKSEKDKEKLLKEC